MKRASWLLPVPLSPSSSTLASDAATLRAASSAAFIFALSATSAGTSFSTSRCDFASAARLSASRRTRSRSSSIANGLSR